MVGQGLLPGRTLSSSDGLWTMAPWASLRPSERPAAGRELRAGRRRGRLPALLPVTRATRCRTSRSGTRTSWPAGRSWRTPSRRSSRRSPAPAYVLPFWKALAADGGAQAVRRRRSAPTCLGRALGMRFGGALLAGVVFAFGTFFVVWLAWPLTNVFPLIPWLLLLTELVVRRPGRAAGRPGSRRWWRSSSSAGTPRRASTCMFATVAFFAFRLVLALVARRPPACLLRPAARLRRRAGGRRHGDRGGDARSRCSSSCCTRATTSAGSTRTPATATPSTSGALFLFDYWGRADPDHARRLRAATAATTPAASR